MNGTSHSRTSSWLRGLAFLSALLLVAAPLATRFGLLHFSVGLPLTAAAVLLAGMLLLVTLLLMLFPRFRLEMRRLLGIIAIVAIPVAVGARVLINGIDLPHIHDISTDIADPPQFTAAPAMRGDDSNPLERDAKLDAAQRAAYANLDAIRTDAAPPDVFDQALATAEALKWKVYFSSRERGMIEASETTFWFGFVDDVAIRVRSDGSGTRIDLRSVSRVGVGDLGANAKRIERFRQAFGKRG